MKKSLSITCYVILALYSVLPICKSLLYLFGYTLSLFNYTVFAIVTAAISIFGVILTFINKGLPLSKTEKILFAILYPLLAIANCLFYPFVSNSVTAVICIAVCLFCSIILTVRLIRPSALKFLSLILSILMIYPLFVYTFATLTIGRIGENTVIETVDSPSGKYYAQLIDCDQGLLGGSTIVDVYEKWEINALLFKITKSPSRVYIGPWGAYKDLKVSWEDHRCLLINSHQHIID